MPVLNFGFNFTSSNYQDKMIFRNEAKSITTRKIQFFYLNWIVCICLTLSVTPSHAQEDGTDSTVTYPAAFFAEYSPLTVNDMLDHIPGIELILQSTISSSDGNRGLGSSAQVLLDGKRMAGKANEARSQLDRISADQVSRIEIIRGSSSGLDVQNSGQIVNIVLLEAQSRSSLTTEITATQFDDGTFEPGGSIAWSGQTGNWTYLFSGEVSSGYQHTEGLETSINGDYSLNEIIKLDRYRDQSNYSINSNLTYTPTSRDRVSFNMLYGENDPPSDLFRTITDFNSPSPVVSYEREDIPASSSNWEFGGEYEHSFDNGNRLKLLLIVNEKESKTTRERFLSSTLGGDETKDLFLETGILYQEKILRTSYTFGLAENQGLELGIEVSQTTQDSSLRLGTLTESAGVPEFGGLTPVSFPNAFSTVEEIRIEPFAVHNWQINSRLTLESSLVAEYSEIEQSGDLSVSRDFDFLKTKFDLRFDLNNSLQFKASLEQFVSQLSFADFSRATNESDDDQDTVAGNPELNPEESLRAEFGIDYRLPNDSGVLNARYFYYDWKNKISKIDISPSASDLQSTNGNVGSAAAYGLIANASIRLGMIGLPQALLTGAITVQESEFHNDPLAPKEHGFRPYDRGSYRIGFRHDLPSLRLNYGINYNARIEGGRHGYDVDNRFTFTVPSNLSVFVEKVGFAGLTYRFEGSNLKNYEGCNERRRYDGYIRDGILTEIEDICTVTGRQFAVKIRGTF